MKNDDLKKNKRVSILLIIVFFAGLFLLLYPVVSDYWNSLYQSRAISSYVDVVTEMDDDSYEDMWKQAQAYNAALQGNPNRFQPSEEQRKNGEKLLDVTGNGIIGYVEIPSIDVMLPVYHGTDEEVLQVAIGHVEGSSLPIGGAGTHCVISGHRGLPSSRLFTDLDQLAEGDIFILRVLDETLTYEVDQIRIVEPEDISLLGIEEGKDFCTLVTCTPYGVNSHRLLVRGHRVENQQTFQTLRVTADAMLVDARLVAPILAIPILLVLVLLVALRPLMRKRKSERGDK